MKIWQMSRTTTSGVMGNFPSRFFQNKKENVVYNLDMTWYKAPESLLFHSIRSTTAAIDFNQKATGEFIVNHARGSLFFSE
jgi:hypothetical protein